MKHLNFLNVPTLYEYSYRGDSASTTKQLFVISSYTMRLLTLLAIVYHTHARVVDVECDGIVVNNIIHEQEILLHVYNSPYQLAIDYNTNTLFFSFTSLKKDVMFESGYLNLKTKEFNIIANISEGFSNAVDSNSHTVYLGGDDGIYSFNYDTKQAKHLLVKNQNIWQLFYKNNNLYYTTYPDEFVYIFKNGTSERVPELSDTKARLVGIDNKDYIYFSNKSGLYVHTSVDELYLGNYNIECFTSDINGNLYFATYGGIYQIYDKKVENIASMKQIYGMAVEKDGNIIVGFRDFIVRLKSTKVRCYVPEKKLE